MENPCFSFCVGECVDVPHGKKFLYKSNVALEEKSYADFL